MQGRGSEEPGGWKRLKLEGMGSACGMVGECGVQESGGARLRDGRGFGRPDLIVGGGGGDEGKEREEMG